jgi:hypothetical protein
MGWTRGEAGEYGVWSAHFPERQAAGIPESVEDGHQFYENRNFRALFAMWSRTREGDSVAGWPGLPGPLFRWQRRLWPEGKLPANPFCSQLLRHNAAYLINSLFFDQLIACLILICYKVSN